MSLMVTPNIECVESSDTYGRFVAEPLERGFGITLGNALRRVLLSSLPGAAVTWVRIEGVEHEFSTIPNMKEDTTEFLLNVKEIRLRPSADRAGKMILDVSGEGMVSASDISPSADFEIINPELHLATLNSPDARLIVEFNVELGKGYIPADKNDGLPIGVIPVDAIFTPIRRVNYAIELTRIGQETSFERLILEVWTDGTTSPIKAVSESAEILVEQFALFQELALAPLGELGKKPPHLLIPMEQYNMPIEQLGLSVRTLNCLRRGNISKVGELLEKSEDELLEMRNFGRRSLQEVQENLGTLGISYPMGAPEEDSEEEGEE